MTNRSPEPDGWSFLTDQLRKLADTLGAVRLTTSVKTAPAPTRTAIQQLADELSVWQRGHREMTDRHKKPPLTFRPPADIRAWLAETADATGQPISVIVIDALREYKERHISETATPAAIPGR
jgi:hypothetical protein